MEWTSKEILKRLPDFYDMMKVGDEIGDLILKKLRLEAEIKSTRANVVMEVSTGEKYYINGKQPAMNFIDSTYKVTGLAGEIPPLEYKLAELTASLEAKKIQYEVYKNLLDMWRTLSANERNSGV